MSTPTDKLTEIVRAAPQTCIRRPTSIYTECPCDNCRADQRRKAKMLRSGITPVLDQRDSAWRRLESWVELGYTSGTIAALTGHSAPATRRLVASLRAGRRPRMTHEAARRIVTAPDRPTNTHGRIPAVGANRRLRALAAMGWTLKDLSAHCGVSYQTLSDLRGESHPMTTPKFAEIIRRLYDDLSMKPGFSPVARRCAERHGWHGPLAWDDDTIDDPNAQPDLGAPTVRAHGGQGTPVADLVENIEWLLRHDGMLTASELADRFGYRDRSAIQTALARNGYRDLLDRLNRNSEMRVA